MPEDHVLSFAVTAALVAGLAVALVRAKGSNPNQPQQQQQQQTRTPISNPMTRDEFKEHFAGIKKALAQEALQKYEMPALASAHLDRMLEYTVPGGKVNRGMAVVSAVETFAPHLCQTAQQRRQVAALGWTIEFMQGSFLVSDDIMDSSVTRRGQPCWYRVEDIGKTAINDALILLTQVDLVLTRFVKASPAVEAKLRNLLTDTTYATELGQLLDLTTQPPGGVVDLSKYTLERYKVIVKYKTAFYSFVCPVQLGLVYAGMDDADTMAAVKDVLLEMGEYFQIQDDVLDIYGDAATIGKIGTDIKDAKCGWPVVQALMRASEEDKKVLRANYGKDDNECEGRVKVLFKKMGIEKLFEKYEDDVVAQIRAKIAKIPDQRVGAVLTDLLSKIYKRDK